MSFSADDFARVKELEAQGMSRSEIERYTGISRHQVARILGSSDEQPPVVNDDLSVRQKQRLLAGWR